MKPWKLDLHTHTLASGHAYGTITEMAQAAAQKGIEILGITEHARGIPGTCEDIYFNNLHVVPRDLAGIRLLLGSEINIVDYEGGLSMEAGLMRRLDLRIAGIHSQCYTFGTEEQNTAAVVGAIRNPLVDMISHPDDGFCPLNYEEIVRAARESDTLLELNNHSLTMPSRRQVFENQVRMLRLCREQEVMVILSSDAHFPTDIGNADMVEKVIEEVQFPQELIYNYAPEKLLRFLEQKHRRAAQHA